MILNDLLKTDFGIDLPISGGLGNSIDNAIIIHRSGVNDYLRTEYSILECLGKVKGIEWEVLEQALLKHNGSLLIKLCQNLLFQEKEVNFDNYERKIRF
jgi:hypothetical protein